MSEENFSRRLTELEEGFGRYIADRDPRTEAVERLLMAALARAVHERSDPLAELAEIRRMSLDSLPAPGRGPVSDAVRERLEHLLAKLENPARP